MDVDQGTSGSEKPRIKESLPVCQTILAIHAIHAIHADQSRA